jgi:hypothetical protein
MEPTNPEPGTPLPEPQPVASEPAAAAPPPEPVVPAQAVPAPSPDTAAPAVPAHGSLANEGDAAAARAAARGAALKQLGLRDPLPLTVIREYKGKQQKDANGEFAKEAQQFYALGYIVTSQSWAQGQWGCGAWLLALLAILLVGLGLLILAFMLIVKPTGTLTVTYTLKD